MIEISVAMIEKCFLNKKLLDITRRLYKDTILNFDESESG